MDIPENNVNTVNPLTTVLTFPGLIKGMNGAGGLLRMNWRARKRQRDTWIWFVKGETKNRHPGKVRMDFVRYSSGVEMDYDGLVSTGKLLLDACVMAGVITDDKPSIIAEKDYRQEKCKRSEQRTVITFTDL